LIAAKQLKLDPLRRGTWPWTEALTADLDEQEATSALPPEGAAAVETTAALAKRGLLTGLHTFPSISFRELDVIEIWGETRTPPTLAN